MGHLDFLVHHMSNSDRTSTFLPVLKFANPALLSIQEQEDEKSCVQQAKNQHIGWRDENSCDAIAAPQMVRVISNSLNIQYVIICFN